MLAFSFSPCYFFQSSSLWGDILCIQSGFSHPVVTPLWKQPQTYTECAASICWCFTSQPSWWSAFTILNASLHWFPHYPFLQSSSQVFERAGDKGSLVGTDSHKCLSDQRWAYQDVLRRVSCMFPMCEWLARTQNRGRTRSRRETIHIGEKQVELESHWENASRLFCPRWHAPSQAFPSLKSQKLTTNPPMFCAVTMMQTHKDRGAIVEDSMGSWSGRFNKLQCQNSPKVKLIDSCIS